MKTLKSSFNIKGVGLMSGVEFEVKIKPTDSKGIYFTKGDKKILANLGNVVSADHCVVVANISEGANFKVALIEHFMAACAISGLDGVEMEFPNLPVDMNQDVNLNEIVEARTFGYLKDLETFQKMGLSKGVTIDNTVGMTDEGGFTTELRSKYEPNKHKILDIIGDLYLTGINPLKIKANIIVKEAGHALHIEAAKLLKNCF